MDDCRQIVDSYLKWIRDNTMVKTIAEGQTCLISTPFLDRHNDHIEIYVIKKDNKYILTDDGYTLGDLKLSGFEVNSPKREHIFKTVLNGFGIKTSGDELIIDSTLEDLGQKKHRLLQAILAVNDMFNLSQEMVHSLFKEDVELYFKTNNIVFTKDIKLTGKTGFDHNIDFLIPASKTKPERLIQTINTPRKDTISLAVFAFNDISQFRNIQAKNYVIFNDTDKSVPTEPIEALNKYDILGIPWSRREICLNEYALN